MSWLFSGNVSYHVLVDPDFGDFGGELGPSASTLGEVIDSF